jgi:hypothetical protein
LPLGPNCPDLRWRLFKRQVARSPSQAEELESRGIGSHSLVVGPPCDLGLLAFDLDRRCGYSGWRTKLRYHFARLDYHFARRCLLRKVRNRRRNDGGLYTRIDIYPRWSHPVRSDPDDRSDHVAVVDGFRFGKIRRNHEQERKERSADGSKITK